MENLFSSISSGAKIELLNNEHKRRALAMYLFRFAPLNTEFTQDKQSEETPEDLINSIKEMTTKKSISELIELVLQLGAPYWKFECSRSFEEMWAYLNKRIVCDPPPELGQALRDDLKMWLSLSLFYSSVFLDNSHIKKGELNTICPSKSNKRTFYQYLNNFKKRSPIFLEAFYNGENIDTTNFLDLEIISKIVSSVDYFKNSFLLSAERPNNLPKNPLRLFADLTLNPEAPSEFLSNLLSYGENPVTRKFNYQICAIYNQFLLERISCMNFLSVFANCYLENEPNLFKYTGTNLFRLKWLIDMVSSPLLNFRLAFLKYFARSNPTFESDENIVAIHLSRFIDYHLRCTIPLLDLLIHFVIGIRLSKQSKADRLHFLEKERIQYFDKMAWNNSQIAWFFDLKGVPTRDKKSLMHIPSAKEDSTILFEKDNNHHLQFMLLSTFFENTIKLAKENLLSAPVKKVLREQQIQLFQDNLKPPFQPRSEDALHHLLIK